MKKQWIYCYRDPRTGKEFGLGRDRRIASLKQYRPILSCYPGAGVSH
ncbi:hypothetical protein C6086_05470 [Escherichia coli]|nr:hypothetical protein C6086_05470 [Escherichia coli]